ncbi:MAG: asparagine synthase B [Zetaproteobacteria bacterium]|nr:asparagine synthase B [Zetaproteobacteria bacterium]
MCGLLSYWGQDPALFAVLPEQLQLLRHRGPDQCQELVLKKGYLGFQRLSLMDTSLRGQQPMQSQDGCLYLVCNGEIYNFRELRAQITYPFVSHSDSEVLLALLQGDGLRQTLRQIVGEFAFVCFDMQQQKCYAARDPLGIRPLFMGKTERGEILFASEAKALHTLCVVVQPFPPGCYFDGSQVVRYDHSVRARQQAPANMEEVLSGVRVRLERAVQSRLFADVPLGFLLSGGLDSSLVCSIAQRASSQPICTYAIGMQADAIDLKYAREVADFLQTSHTEVVVSSQQVLQVLHQTIWHLETWDVTTIRASLGMFLVGEYIHHHSEIKGVLTGEVSDELFGYKYTDYAPDAEAFQQEAVKRVEQLYMYDVLRADRCLAAHSLEARVPFADIDFVRYVMQIPAHMKMNRYNMGKYLLRMAFAGGDYLPQSILFREKAAFSDAIGHSLVDDIQVYAARKYTPRCLQHAQRLYTHAKPYSYESLLYREIFESFYPGRAELVKGFWMPNPQWHHCDVQDPSARYLPNYGASGV